MNQKIDLNAGWKRVREDAVESGRSVWLAGLGLVSTVDESSRRVLDTLIARGEAREERDRTQLARILRENRDRALRLGRDVEERVEREISASLGRLGIASGSEVRDLIGRIESLTTEVEALGATRGA